MSTADREAEGVTITVKPGGPYLVRGPVVLVQADGTALSPPPAKTPGLIKLCSCGLSENKPFCDASHKRGLPTPEGGASANPAV